jgi:hypothetical protein
MKKGRWIGIVLALVCVLTAAAAFTACEQALSEESKHIRGLLDDIDIVNDSKKEAESKFDVIIAYYESLPESIKSKVAAEGTVDLLNTKLAECTKIQEVIQDFLTEVELIDFQLILSTEPGSSYDESEPNVATLAQCLTDIETLILYYETDIKDDPLVEKFIGEDVRAAIGKLKFWKNYYEAHKNDAAGA